MAKIVVSRTGRTVSMSLECCHPELNQSQAWEYPSDEMAEAALQRGLEAANELKSQGRVTSIDVHGQVQS